MSFIVGQDISSAQGQINWPTFKNNSNFVIMKASEGVGFIDKWFGYNRQQSRLLGLPRGFYHFARPDLGNSATEEAQWFCNLIDGDPIHDGEVLCLDMEVQFGNAVEWCKEWLDFVSSHFKGVKPLIYMNQSTASSLDWSSVVNEGYGLWLASYTYNPNTNTGNTGKWPSMAIQQWTDKQSVPGISGNVDGDVFFGSTTQFMEYGYKTPVVTPTPTPVTPVETPPVIETPTTSTSDPTPVPDPNSGTVSVPTPEPSQPTTPTIPTVPTTEPTTPPVIVTPTKSNIIQEIFDWVTSILAKWKKN